MLKPTNKAEATTRFQQPRVLDAFETFLNNTRRIDYGRVILYYYTYSVSSHTISVKEVKHAQGEIPPDARCYSNFHITVLLLTYHYS